MRSSGGAACAGGIDVSAVRAGGLAGVRLTATFASGAVRDRWPPIELVVTSGRVLPGATDLPKRARFVSKPYGPAQVAKTFWELVA
jgi:two-component system, response regulator PdtaR